MIADLTASAGSYSEKAEAASTTTCTVKSNTLRKTAREKTQELGDINHEDAEKLQEICASTSNTCKEWDKNCTRKAQS